MDFTEYQHKSRKYDHVVAGIPSWAFWAVSLAEEAGEVLGKIKRILRDDGGVITSTRRTDVIKELGDLMYNVARVADAFDVDFQEIADASLAKLEDRYQRGVLKGSGDNR